MKRQLIFMSIFFLFLYSCEEIYVPNLDAVDNFLVVEGSLISNQEINEVKLYMSENFNQEVLEYPPVTDASVFLISESGDIKEFVENAPGQYQINYTMKNNVAYRLKIEVQGEIYESAVQVAPDLPHLDKIYGDLTSMVYVDDKDEVKTDIGYRVYADIAQQGDLKNYRFYARKILQYIHYIDTLPPDFMEPIKMPVYNWRSYSPTGIYNIAGPPDYSTEDDILKHPMEFFIKDTRALILDTQYFAGWIYIIDQYGISEDTYDYYSDLNTQLGSDGKIFDPVYTQAEGNIKCMSNPKLEVLGNFEIATYKEHRFFLKYNRRDDNLALKYIPYFYNIPLRGKTKGNQPDFWETTNKTYPVSNEK